MTTLSSYLYNNLAHLPLYNPLSSFSHNYMTTTEKLEMIQNTSVTEEELPEVIDLTGTATSEADPFSTFQEYAAAACSKKSDSARLLYQEQLAHIRDFPTVPSEEIAAKKVLLGEKSKKYTLVLDLDKTLIYSSVTKHADSPARSWDLSVAVRPFACELLQEMSQFYEIVIFTAAEQKYAEVVVDILDPRRKWVKKLLTRESCVKAPDGHLIKDLRIFGDRNIDEMLIVDDNVYSFASQIENGIPVKPFEGKETQDDELSCLMTYLKELYRQEKGLVETNKEAFWS